MKINDLIFKELLKRGYVLEGKTRVWNIADSKLWYLTPSQAQGYLNFEDTGNYKKSVTDKEILLIQKHFKDIIKKLPNRYYNIIDLGCGNGKKALLFIKEFSKSLKIRYCPIDISSYMVEKAAKTIRSLNMGEVIEFKWNVSDFENLSNITPLLRGDNFKNNLLLLLGNTLGNFDREDIINGIKESMVKGDILIIGNGITNGKKSEWINSYKDEIINKWLIQIPLQLSLEKSDLEYDVRFVNSRIEENYILKNDKIIVHLGRKLELKKGDRIIVAVSYKYSREDFGKNLKKFFNDVTIFTDKEETYTLALCKI